MLKPSRNPKRSHIPDFWSLRPHSPPPTRNREVSGVWFRPQGCWWRRRPCLVLSSWGVQGPDAPRGARTPQGGSAGWVCSPVGSMFARWPLASRSPEKPCAFCGAPPGLLRISSPVCVVSLGGTPCLASPRGVFTPPHGGVMGRGGSLKMKDYFLNALKRILWPAASEFQLQGFHLLPDFSD